MATCFSFKTFIHAPCDKVFAHASDFRRAPEMIRGIKRIEMLTEGPVGVGTRFKETRVMFKREQTEIMEVVAFDPPHGYTLGIESCGCRFRSDFRFTPNGQGTDVELSFEAQPLSWIGKIMGFLMKPMMKMCLKAMQKDLESLKQSIESDGTGIATATLNPQPA